eukprot:TRINITY_DN2610_c0_g1_i2.p1 TRINITY_DN2610_c0_g1~~TRINITY_DN2610_c0_g1_i2.p1  ORF type:complete len:318 (+),score=84.14 TRINITY_DN2610_c0_g1_i2:102-1055(+)
MTSQYPSLEQYVSPSSNTQQEYSTSIYESPAPSSSSAPNTNYPQLNTYTYSATPQLPDKIGAPSTSTTTTPGSSSSSSTSNPQGFFQDMGFLQEAAITHMGSRFYDNGRQYVDRNFGRFMSLTPVKYYFNVTNSYVLKKLALVTFPFLHKNWQRQPSTNNDGSNLAPPREDINAPDLYIPIMAFVTYILVVGFFKGATTETFTPEILGYTASKGLIAMALELFVLRTSFYMLNTNPNVSLLDMLAFCGYIFVGLTWKQFILFYFPVAHLPVALYTGLAASFFVIRAVKASSQEPKLLTVFYILCITFSLLYTILVFQ